MAATGLYDSVFLTLQTTTPPHATEVQVPVLAQVRESALAQWVYGAGMSTDIRAAPVAGLHPPPHSGSGLAGAQQGCSSTPKLEPLLSTRLYSLPDATGWNWFASASAERAELADYDTNSISLAAGRGKDRGQHRPPSTFCQLRPGATRKATKPHPKARPSAPTTAGRGATSTTPATLPGAMGWRLSWAWAAR